MISSIFASINMANIYGTNIHKNLNELSIKWTGTNFSSGRLERWSEGYRLSNVSWGKMLFGYGLDGTLYYIKDLRRGKSMHNMWLDTLLRVGWIGILLKYLLIIFIKIVNITNERYSNYLISFSFSLPILMGIYS